MDRFSLAKNIGVHLLYSFSILLLWNNVVPEISALSEISYLQAISLKTLVDIFLINVLSLGL